MTVTVVPFHPEFAPAFDRLNRAWIERLFEIEAEDEHILGDPIGAVIVPGGQIFFAIVEGEAVGTVAAVRVSPDHFELAKMAVDPRCQGRGIGGMLVEAVIRFARDAGATTVFLISNSALTNAVRLYERCGFQHRPLTGDHRFARVDVYMEYPLSRQQQ